MVVEFLEYGDTAAMHAGFEGLAAKARTASEAA
jgi:hypothetical protein